VVLSEEDKTLIKNMYICKGYSARQLISATRAGVYSLCKMSMSWNDISSTV